MTESDKVKMLREALAHYDNMTSDADQSVSEFAESVRSILAATAQPEPTCFLCNGTGIHEIAHAIPAGIEPPPVKFVECQQCKVMPKQPEPEVDERPQEEMVPKWALDSQIEICNDLRKQLETFGVQVIKTPNIDIEDINVLKDFQNAMETKAIPELVEKRKQELWGERYKPTTQPNHGTGERQALFFAASQAINTGARLTGKMTLWGIFEKGWEAHKEFQARANLGRGK